MSKSQPEIANALTRPKFDVSGSLLFLAPLNMIDAPVDLPILKVGVISVNSGTQHHGRPDVDADEVGIRWVIHRMYVHTRLG